MVDEALIAAIKRKSNLLRAVLDERSRRVWAATEASALGHGGMVAVAKATGLSERTIRRGYQDVQSLRPAHARSPARQRRPGGGRQLLQTHDPALMAALEALVAPTTRGDPMSPLRWTCKSTRKWAQALRRQGPPSRPTTVAHLLPALGYSVQGTRKTQDGRAHPDRDAQFPYINTQVKAFQKAGQPVISVDAKKKECVGDFAMAGQAYHPQGHPEQVRVHHCPDPLFGKVCPSGVYDMTAKTGWVSVGIDHDTAQCAVASIRRWWVHMGHTLYPQAGK